VGGPILDNLHSSASCHRRPIITPPISSSTGSTSAAAGDTDARQYLLIPSRKCIDVLSMENGRTFARLVLGGGGEEEGERNDAEINAVCLTRAAVLQQPRQQQEGEDDEGGGTSSSEDDDDDDDNIDASALIASDSPISPKDQWVILAGCTDGTVQEWTLHSAVLSSPHRPQFSGNKTKRGAAAASRSVYDSSLPNVAPRRIMTLGLAGMADGSKNQTGQKRLDGVTHLCSPVFHATGDDNSSTALGTIFALVHADAFTSRLVRMLIPPLPSVVAGADTTARVELKAGASGDEAAAAAVVEIGSFSLKRKGEGKREKKKAEAEADAAAEGTTPKRRRVVKVQSLPFDLLLSMRGEEEVSVIVVSESGIAVYNDKLSSSTITDDRIVSYPKTRQNTHISSACVALNGTDVAIGYAEGHIDIFVDLLESARSYLAANTDDRSDVMANVVIRSVHWHTHSVSSLTFLGAVGATKDASTGAASGAGGNPSLNLLSGGEESVLLTWNLDRGFNRPVHTLPRLAKGGIVNIVSNPYVASNVDIVVYCTDNTLRLINGYNYSTKWRTQGLADAPVDPPMSILTTIPAPACPGTILLHDPRTRLPILSNLPGAPGSVHWYDPSSQRVVGTLEIAPYNRISRRDSNDAAVPSPNVTHLCLSESGDDMITIDTILTENSGSGGMRQVASHGGSTEERMSLFTTIKFWSWSNDGSAGGSTRGQMKEGRLEMPYQLISAMPSPHGLAGEVSSLAMTYDGTKACTLSHEEGAFRVWSKGRDYDDDNRSAEPPAPLWKCLYKITTPSGFSRAVMNVPSIAGQRLAFSSDGSVLAVCYGDHVTLWDHSNSSLLASVKNCESIIDVEFTKTGSDTLLLRGTSSVSIQAPFGTNNPAYLGATWSYSLTKQGDLANLKGEVEVAQAVPIASRKEVAVALFEKTNNITSVVILDEVTGDAKANDDGSQLFWQIPGKLHAMCEVSRKDATGESTVPLVALTEHHELLALECASAEAYDNEEYTTTESSFYDVRSKSEAYGRVGNSTSGAPTLVVGNSINKRRRKSKGQDFDTNQDLVGRFGSSHADGSSSKSVPLPSSDLPTLSNEFTKDFIGRALRRS